ncbi:unnamed protein product [Ectocarpus sp. 12 AP-2014]
MTDGLYPRTLMCFTANKMHHAIRNRVEIVVGTSNYQVQLENFQKHSSATATFLLSARRVRQRNILLPPPSASSSDHSTWHIPSGRRLEIKGRTAPRKPSAKYRNHTPRPTIAKEKKTKQASTANINRSIRCSKDEAGKNAYLKWEPRNTYPGLCLQHAINSTATIKKVTSPPKQGKHGLGGGGRRNRHHTHERLCNEVVPPHALWVTPASKNHGLTRSRLHPLRLRQTTTHTHRISTHIPSPTAFPSSTSNIKTCLETHTSTTTHNIHQAPPVSRSYACAPARRKPFHCTQSYPPSPPTRIHSAPSIFSI